MSQESFRLIPTRSVGRRVLIWVHLAIPGQHRWVCIGWYGMFIIPIPVYCCLVFPARMLIIGETGRLLPAARMVHWVLMTVVFGLSHAAFLPTLRDGEDHGHPAGPGRVFSLVMLTERNDISQLP